MNKQQQQLWEQRAKALLDQMDLVEKASLLRYDSPAIPRLGIPAYNWWNEGLHGVARTGTATVFPQAIGLAATFDEDLVQQIGDAVATEARAKFNENRRLGVTGRYKGLTLWAPNINIFRDPRWGRGQETYGEDPYLTSRLGVAYIRGLQGEDETYLKTAACAKHFAVHSGPEQGRHEFDSVVDRKDLYETYLPAFEAAVKQGNVASVMGAYNRLNGEVCCGNTWLIQDLLRRQWGFSGYFVSDCGAIHDFHVNHKVTKTPQESAAKGVKAGCDINCGDVYTHIVQAVEMGLLTEQDVEVCATRALVTRMRLGLLGDETPYDRIGLSAVDCKAHRQLAETATRRSCVLLKNDGILPIDKTKYSSIGVIGPNAHNEAMLNGNYNGTSPEYVTLLDGIIRACEEQVTVRYARGCHHYWTPENNEREAELQSLPEALSVAQNSDLVILCLGLDPTFEGEEGDANNPYGAGDRTALHLPPVQQKLVQEIGKLGKPTVLVLSAGSGIDVSREEPLCNGVLDVFYPGGRGGKGVADVLFGKTSPSGCLPITVYKSEKDLPPFTHYGMQGRTYRYFTGTPLYPFGYGLTYGRAELTRVAMAKEFDQNGLTVEVTLENHSDYDQYPLVQVYVQPERSRWAPPNPCLCGFLRVDVAKGQTKKASLTIDAQAFTVVDDQGNRLAEDDTYRLYVGLCPPDEQSQQRTGHKVLCQRVRRTEPVVQN